MKSFWRKPLVEEDNETPEGLITYLTYLSLIGGFILVGLSIRNYIWSKRFEAGECPFRVEDPGRMLEVFRKMRLVGLLLAGSLMMIFAGILVLVGSLISQSSGHVFEVVSVSFFFFTFSIFLLATSRYFAGFLSHMEKLESLKV